VDPSTSLMVRSFRVCKLEAECLELTRRVIRFPSADAGTAARAAPAPSLSLGNAQQHVRSSRNAASRPRTPALWSPGSASHALSASYDYSRQLARCTSHPMLISCPFGFHSFRLSSGHVHERRSPAHGRLLSMKRARSQQHSLLYPHVRLPLPPPGARYPASILDLSSSAGPAQPLVHTISTHTNQRTKQ
jgi:hypothetical protein